MKFMTIAQGLLIASLATAATAGEMIITSENPQNHWKSGEIDKLAKAIEEKSGGNISTTTYHANLYKGDREAVEAIGTGSVHMVWPACPRMEALVPELGILSLPFTLSAEEMATPEFQAKVVAAFAPALAEKGFALLGVARATEVMFVGSSPLSSFSDLEGKKIRVPGSPLFKALMGAFGASSISLPASELATALSQGAIDAAFTSPSSWRNIGVRGAKYGLVPSNLLVGTYCIVADKAWLDGLDASDKAAVEDATAELMRTQWTVAYENDLKSLDAMVEAGAELVVLKDTSEFRAATEELRKEYMLKYESIAKALAD